MVHGTMSSSVQPVPLPAWLRGMGERFGPGRRAVFLVALVGVVAGFFPWFSLYYFGLSSSENGWSNWGTVSQILFVFCGAVAVLPVFRCSVRGLFPTLPTHINDARVVQGMGAAAAFSAI